MNFIKSFLLNLYYFFFPSKKQLEGKSYCDANLELFLNSQNFMNRQNAKFKDKA